MAVYQEYCPLGRTDKKITFTVEGTRAPAPTEPCICGTESGIGGPEILNALADVNKAFGEEGAARPLEQLARSLPATQKPHLSAIRQIG